MNSGLESEEGKYVSRAKNHEHVAMVALLVSMMMT